MSKKAKPRMTAAFNTKIEDELKNNYGIGLSLMLKMGYEIGKGIGKDN